MADIEAELKFRLDDLDAFRQRLSNQAFEFVERQRQRDIYFSHPMRDFASTDEAFRIRTFGQNACVTYKGPRIDGETKSRHEIEIRFLGGDADGERFAEMLTALGFTAVYEVAKTRDIWSVATDRGPIHAMVDSVDGLGDFVELEQTVERSQFEKAKSAILEMACVLGLEMPEHRSYLAMLMAARKEH